MKESRLSWACGPSHAGKSFYSKKWLRQLANLPRVVIDTDTIRRAIHGKLYNREAEPVVYSHEQIMLKTFLLDGYEVFFSETNTTRSSIKKILEIDPWAKPVIFDVPLDVCVERTKLTNQPHMIPVIQRHHKQLQELLSYGLERTLDEIRDELEYRWKK